jgi:arylsulfatase A-like enzyme
MWKNTALGLLVFCAVGLAGCGSSEPASVAIRLVDLFEPDAVEGAATEVVRPPRTEWRFDGSAEKPEGKFAATYGWQAGRAVTGLAIRNGRLTGRSTADFPIIHVERTSGLDDGDLLHAVEIRLRASAGSNLSISQSGSEKLDLAAVVEQAQVFPWLTTTPIVQGREFRTYTLRPRRPVASRSLRHLLIRPTDVAGASFEIESVRLVFRKEYLANIPAGVGWHGLSEVYRETLVARAPETIRIQVKLPARPWLDLGIGTIEEGPVTFRVTVGREGSAAEGTTILERTVTTPHRWQPVRIDLTSFARREVEFSLSLISQRPGAIGFWGSPVVRDSGRMPERVAGPHTPATPPQGVILILADTLRSDHLSAYGYSRPTAPVLSSMAGEGVLFRDCVAQGTWTKVSGTSLLTGLYPTTHTVAEFADRLPSSAVTLAEVFRAAGYATLSTSSVLFTGKFTNLHQGFEELHERSSISEDGSKTAREFVDRLLPWLEDHRGVPFFVFLHIFDPHDPFQPRRPYDTLWADPARTEEHKRQMEKLRKFIPDSFMRRRGLPTQEELQKSGLDQEPFISHLYDWYDGSIRAMDVEIGRVLEHLRTLGLEEKTLVVFTSDHGEEFLEHGRMFHGQSVYGELANVPLIIRQLGTVPQGVAVDETVQLIDIMPTVLELSGLPLPEGVQGQSLVSFFTGVQAASVQSAGFLQGNDGDSSSVPGQGSRLAVTEKAALQDKAGPRNYELQSFAVILDGWKLIHNRKRPAEEPEYELYDHRNDPLDTTDLAAEKPQIVQRLARELEAWYEKVKAARLQPDSAATEGLSREELERLRSLGYIQ